MAPAAHGGGGLSIIMKYGTRTRPPSRSRLWNPSRPLTIFVHARLSSHAENRDVLNKFYLAFLAMAVVPLASFFLIKLALTSLTAWDADRVVMISGIAAVVTVNLVIAAYAYVAWLEPDERLSGARVKAD